MELPPTNVVRSEFTGSSSSAIVRESSIHTPDTRNTGSPSDVEIVRLYPSDHR